MPRSKKAPAVYRVCEGHAGSAFGGSHRFTLADAPVSEISGLVPYLKLHPDVVDIAITFASGQQVIVRKEEE